MSSSDLEDRRDEGGENEPEIDIEEDDIEEDGDGDDIRRTGSRRNRTVAEVEEADNNDNDDEEIDEGNDDEDDDIFGDGGNNKNGGEKDIDDDNDNDNDDNNFDDPFGEQQQEREEVPLRIEQTTIPRYPRSHSAPKDLYLVPTPAFMTLDPHPFKADKFQEEVTNSASRQEDQSTLKLRNENTVRWKYARDLEGNVTRQSNTRVIKWSDGSMSLQLGQEMFDIVVQDPYEQTFLCLSHPANELLQTSGIFTKNMRFVPTSTASLTHKRLTEELAKKQLIGSTSISSVATVDDPEKVQREAEKVQEMTIRARRKLESKQRQQQERTMGIGGGANAGHSSRYESTSAYDRSVDRDHQQARNDQYEEDDFVVDDEDEEEIEGEEGSDDNGEEGEEEEGDEDVDDLEIGNEKDEDEAEQERAKRLHDVKQKGAELYNRTNDKDDSSQQSRKKRRIFDDEDEDDG